MFASFGHFIDQKKAEKLALVLNKALTTIYSYKTRGCIPRDRWPELLAEFEDLSMGDLIRMEAVWTAEKAQSASKAQG